MNPDWTGVAEDLVKTFAEALVQVLESMTDQRPDVQWEPGAGPLNIAVAEEDFWWQQPFQIMPSPAVWVRAPRATWEELGGRTLRAAGLDAIEPADARNTWLEILSQALSTLARATGSLVHQEVTCQGGAENVPPADAGPWANVSLGFGNPLEPVTIIISGGLLGKIEAASRGDRETASDPSAADAPPDLSKEQRRTATYGPTLDLLLDVELPVSISFGRTRIPLKDVLKLATGSIVELNRNISEPVEVLVNHSLIARGEVVVVDGNYGVRIQQVVNPEDRLRGIR